MATLQFPIPFSGDAYAFCHVTFWLLAISLITLGSSCMPTFSDCRISILVHFCTYSPASTDAQYFDYIWSSCIHSAPSLFSSSQFSQYPNHPVVSFPPGIVCRGNCNSCRICPVYSCKGSFYHRRTHLKNCHSLTHEDPYCSI